MDLLGGKCERCGATEGLQFDHKQPNKKEFRIADRIDAPEDILQKEVMKCILLCDKCHREKTREMGEHGQPKARHGTLWMYKRYGCRCNKCKQRMSEYNKERRMLLSAMESGMKLKDLVGDFRKFANYRDTQTPAPEIGRKPSKEDAIDVTEDLQATVEQAGKLLNLIVEQSMGNPRIAEMTQELAIKVEEKDFPVAFDILKQLATNTSEKKTHGTLIELARVVASIRNNLNLGELEMEFEEED